MNAEVRPGFKLTDAGMIPDDWHCSMLSEVSITSSGTTPARSQFDRYFRNGKINWVKTLDLNNKKIVKTDEQVTLDALAETCLREYPARTVLIAMYGGFNQIGRTGILGIPACVNQAITAIQCGSLLNPEYLLATLNFRVEHWKTVASSSRKDPNITSQDVRDFLIAYPSIKEQEKISEVLSGIDAQISSLDQLIAKKRDIQQAAMQQLLTGQRRLPGFGRDWELKRLGELAIFLKGQGLSKNELVVGGARPCIHYGELFTHYPVTIWEITSRTNNELAGVLSKENDVLMPTSDVTPRGLAKASCIMRNDVILGGDILIIRPNSNVIDGSFLSYVIRYEEDQVLKLVSGSTVFHLYGVDMKRFEFMTPPLEEQTAIATLLSDMDTELAALEARRDKARQFKQGMMQELLTGRIRLI